jgi:hypothetical protein
MTNNTFLGVLLSVLGMLVSYHFTLNRAVGSKPWVGLVRAAGSLLIALFLIGASKFWGAPAWAIAVANVVAVTLAWAISDKPSREDKIDSISLLRTDAMASRNAKEAGSLEDWSQRRN